MQGASWGAVVVGAYLFFNLFLPLGLLFALLGAFFGAGIGLILVFFFEMAHLKLQIYKESKEHSKLLKKIVRELENPAASLKDENLPDH
jgi:hypothetical protein